MKSTTVEKFVCPVGPCLKVDALRARAAKAVAVVAKAAAVKKVAGNRVKPERVRNLAAIVTTATEIAGVIEAIVVVEAAGTEVIVVAEAAVIEIGAKADVLIATEIQIGILIGTKTVVSGTRDAGIALKVMIAGLEVEGVVR